MELEKLCDINLYQGDCMDLMRKYPDKYFDLAIVDPPYGIGADKKNSKRELKSKKSATISSDFGGQIWDSAIPTEEYFAELKRVSKKQIIWGANYFGLVGGMLYWHKNVTMPTYSTGELAYLSWLQKIDYVNITWHGMLQENMRNKELRIHPTQKPVQLYKWLLQKYAKEGDKILYTHFGSLSIGIACHDLHFELTASELDKEYYELGKNRLMWHQKQLNLF